LKLLVAAPEFPSVCDSEYCVQKLISKLVTNKLSNFAFHILLVIEAGAAWRRVATRAFANFLRECYMAQKVCGWLTASVAAVMSECAVHAPLSRCDELVYFGFIGCLGGLGALSHSRTLALFCGRRRKRLLAMRCEKKSCTRDPQE
jgi:hypothetical protein